MYWNDWSATGQRPPAQDTPITYYGTLNTLLQSSGTLAPSSTGSFDINMKTPAQYNLTFGIQRDIGKSIVLDTSYVANLARHELWNYNLNNTALRRAVPGEKRRSNQWEPLPDNFMVPYPGYYVSSSSVCRPDTGTFPPSWSGCARRRPVRSTQRSCESSGSCTMPKTGTVDRRHRPAWWSTGTT